MAAVVFTLTVTGRRNLGGGAQLVYGTLAADTGDYTTGGVVTTPTFASLDQVSNREPNVVMFDDADGYRWNYDRVNSLLQLYALQLSGAAQANLAIGEHTNAAAVAAGVGADVKWIAFWFPQVTDHSFA
jgi:hypothetical protein